MAQFPASYSYKHFLISSPSPFVAHVQTNRPEKLNAFFEAMWLELGEIFNRLSIDPDVRAVVFSAVGDRAFTSGLDVKAAAQGSMIGATSSDLEFARKAAGLRRHIVEFQDCISAIEKCEKRKLFLRA
jgi:Delta3,5-Delta2,4-dienoyl-CoA isomerase